MKKILLKRYQAFHFIDIQLVMLGSKEDGSVVLLSYFKGACRTQRFYIKTT